MRWLECEDGSIINSRHILRLFPANDITVKGWQVKASLPGPQNPFILMAGIMDEESAKKLVKLLQARLNEASDD